MLSFIIYVIFNGVQDETKKILKLSLALMVSFVTQNAIQSNVVVLPAGFSPHVIPS